MKGIHLTDTEMKFACLLWDNTPMASSEMVQLASEQLQWKKSTAYTVLRFLINKGIFQNEAKIVSTVMSKDDYYFQLGCEMLEECFGGSLTGFVSAYLRKNDMSREDAKAILDAVSTKKKK